MHTAIVLSPPFPTSLSLAHIFLQFLFLCESYVFCRLLSSLSVCLTCASYLLCFVSLNCLSIVWLSAYVCASVCVQQLTIEKDKLKEAQRLIRDSEAKVGVPSACKALEMISPAVPCADLDWIVAFHLFIHWKIIF